MKQELLTPRTRLRPFRLADAPDAFTWFSDPRVMLYIPNGPDGTLAQTITRIQRYMDHEAAHGFSKWIIADRATGELIGDAGFFMMPGATQPELGYRLRHAAWGRGLATEVARAWLSVARDWFGLTEVFAFAHPENAASRHVIEKLGFDFVRRQVIYGVDEILYRVNIAPSAG